MGGGLPQILPDSAGCLFLTHPPEEDPSCTVSAQQSRQPQAGDRLRLSSVQYIGVATLVSLTADTLVILLPDDGDRLAMPTGSFYSLAVSRGPLSSHMAATRGAASGAAVGAVAGLLAGLISGDDTPRCRTETVCFVGCVNMQICAPAKSAGEKGRDGALLVGCVGAVAGAAIGAVTNSVRPAENWHRIPFTIGQQMTLTGSRRMYAGLTFAF